MMQRGSEFDLVNFVKSLDRKRIKYLLIGRWAVILHGAPMMTADYDFWISTDHREELREFLDQKGWEVPDRSQWKKPILTAFCGPDRIDLFFFRSVTNLEGRRLTFDGCWDRSVLRLDKETGFSLRLPCIEDMIGLKKIKRSNQEDAAKDAADVHYLKALKPKKND